MESFLNSVSFLGGWIRCKNCQKKKRQFKAKVTLVFTNVNIHLTREAALFIFLNQLIRLLHNLSDFSSARASFRQTMFRESLKL